MWTDGNCQIRRPGVNATISEHGRLDPDGPGFLATAGAAVEREVVAIEPCFCAAGRPAE